MNKKVSPIVLKVLLITILVLIGLGTVFSGLIGGGILQVMKKTPDIDPENIKYEMSENSTIVDKDGNEIDSIRTSENREIVDFKQMPEHLKHAFIAVEDERFLKHNGIDPISIIGSAIQNFKSGSIVRGGSTLTQQLARNTYLSNDQTYERKIKEIYLALKIEQYLSKDEILEAYMNRVFLGQNSFGVQAASKTYFSKDVSELTIAEAAAIAGIVQSPTEYALFKAVPTSEVTDERVFGEFSIDGQKYSAVYNEKPFERQKYVLSKMLEEGYISDSEYKEALSEDVASNIKPPEDKSPLMASYFNTLLEKQVVKKLQETLNIGERQAWDKLYYGGLKITTTVDNDMQSKLEDVYENFSESILGNTQGWGSAPLLDLRYDNWGNIVKNDGTLIYYAKSNVMNDNNDFTISSDEAYYDENSNLIINSNKISLNNTNLVFKDYYSLDDKNSNLRTHKTGFVKFPSNENIRENQDGSILISASYLKNHNDFVWQNESGSFSFNKEYYDTDLEGVIQPQSSTVVIDQKNGEVKAIMGGRDQKGQKILNRAIDQPRQPGSSVKPLATYTAALDHGYNLATGIDDVPFMKNENGEIWPENVYRSYKGIVSLRDSLVYSVNTNAVRTLKDIGIDTSKKYLKNFGLIKENGDDNFVTKEEDSQKNDENLAAMGLGAMTKGQSVLDMTAAYAALANNGEYIEPLTFSKIEDNQGNIIFDEKDKKKNKVTSPETAYQMTSALMSAGKNYGTINLYGTDYATKTGTSDNNIDFWCIGYTPYYTVGVWMGSDNQNISLNSYSTDRTALMWGVINNRILHDYKQASFEEPSGIIHAKVDTISGKLPTQASYADPRNTVKDEIFSKDNLPTEQDDVHVWILVDTRNNLLASNKTPKNLQANRAFIDRKGSYDPSKWNGILPEDWKYSIPQKYSDLGYVEPKPKDDNKSNNGKKQDDKNQNNLENKDGQNQDEKQQNKQNLEGENQKNNN
ncbi:transglycosylase domain-containing protein [Anaerococcus porci]|uniref:transglycosylase domain-containing protein n=1 Tax=Anaerococcus porci TaxID=2652269 RepID=UPI002A766B89|nr:transglycosylase domain-containing protein [Anaerococcus porci]MDY3005506.1 transglycosylase domain-containing protein [Anaerococcus porci]